MSKEKLLITGSNGTVGKILTERISTSLEVVGVDIARGDSEIETEIADVSIIEQLEVAFRKFSPIQFVIHLAADSNHETNWESAVVNNINGTKNLYALAAKYGVRRVIFASSNHVTGRYEYVDRSKDTNLCDQPRVSKITVEHPVRPDGFYGISKLTGEAIARYYYECHSLESVCLRIGSVTKTDKPENPRHLCTWLSPDDLVQLIEKSLDPRGTFPGFGIYFGVSENSGRFWDIDNASKELGYHPKDDASKFWNENDSSAY